MKDEIKEIIDRAKKLKYECDCTEEIAPGKYMMKNDKQTDNLIVAIYLIDKLLDYITNLQDTLKDREEYCYGLETQLTDLQEENERLNKKYEDAVADYEEQKYITNELEKWLESEIDRIIKLKSPKRRSMPPYGEENYYYENMILRYKEVLDKLKELKEE